MPCAPVAETTPRSTAKATSPSFQLTVHQRRHMSFLDDMSRAGSRACLFTAGTASNAEVDGCRMRTSRPSSSGICVGTRVRCVSNGEPKPGALHLDERGHASSRS